MDVVKSIRKWWPVKPKPAAAPPLAAEKPALLDYARAWKILKDTKFSKIWPTLVSVPVILFFTLSGVIAWLLTVAGFIMRFLRFGMGD